MKRFTKILLFLILSVTVLTLISCQDEQSDRYTVEISQRSLKFDGIGQSSPLEFAVYCNGEPITDEEFGEGVSFSSSNPEVATFDGKTVTTVGYGSCVIRVKYKSVSAACSVNNPNPNPDTAQTDKYKVTLSQPGVIFLNTGETASLGISVTADGAPITDEEFKAGVSYYSSNPDVATFDGETITAVGYGSASIYVKYDTAYAVCTVSNPDPAIFDDPATRYTVVLSKSSITFSDIGESTTIDVKIYANGIPLPEDTYAEDISFYASKSDVVTFDGKSVTAIGYGSCIIGAKYRSADATCTVNNPNPSPPLSISQSELYLDNIGASKQIHAYSDDGTDISTHVEWRTSNKNIAICENGLVIAKGYGSCTISAKSSNQTVVCSVTVNNPTAPYVAMSQNSVKLQANEAIILYATPSTNAGEISSWQSSNPSVVSCEDGVIRAKKTGYAVILAITDLGYTGVSVITVGEPNHDFTYMDYLKFDFPSIGSELKYIDRETGNLLSKVIVTSYVLETPYLLDDGRLVVEISLECVKTYDAQGLDATTPAVVTTDLYSENNVWRARNQYKSANVVVGETFKVKCSGFTVQTLTDGSQRDFYMTFASITES